MLTKFSLISFLIFCCLGLFLGENHAIGQVQDFEETFSIVNIPNEFLENWSANDVRSTNGSRVFQSSGEGRNGSKALGVQPISTFNGRIIVKSNIVGIDDPKIAFFAKSKQNGTGLRAAMVQISIYNGRNSGPISTIRVGDSSTFPNWNTPYRLFQFPIPPQYHNEADLILEIEVRYGEGVGSAARFFMDDFGVFDGDNTIDPIQINKASIHDPYSVELTMDREIKSPNKSQVKIASFPTEELLFYTDSSFVAMVNTPILADQVQVVLGNIEGIDGRVTDELVQMIDNSTIKTGNILIESEKQIQVSFSRLYSPASVSQTSNFLVNGKNPLGVSLDPNGYGVKLSLAEALALDKTVSFVSKNIQDKEGKINTAEDQKSLLYKDFVNGIYLIDESTILIEHSLNLDQESPEFKIEENPEFTFEISYPQSNTIELVSNRPFQEGLIYTLALPSRRSERGYPIPGSNRDFEWDNTPPKLEQVIPISSKKILALFSEPLDIVFASVLSNYSINSNNPTSAVLQENQSQVILDWGFEFESGKTYTAQVSGLADLIGNFLTEQNFEFQFSLPDNLAFKAIVINEVMSAPRSGNVLPNVEYVELFNPGDKAIFLGGLQLGNSKRVTTIPAFLLDPNAYVILTPRSSSPLFTNYGQVLGLSNWPTLLNSGDKVKIMDSNGQAIDSLVYTTATYGGSTFASGGYSLEIVNPFLDCNLSSNLRTSTDSKRGTPGKQNSVFEEVPDLIPMQFVKSTVTGPRSVNLAFSKILNQNIGLLEFDFQPSISLQNVQLGPNPNELILDFGEAIQEGVFYEVKISKLRDCTGNLLESDQKVFFVIPSAAGLGDLVLNEVLFNPRTGAPKFVEIYNASQKFINLKDWKLANLDGDSQIDNRRVLFSEDYILGPGTFLVFTTDSEKLKQEYPKSKEANFVEYSSIPSYPIASGNVVFLTPDETISEIFSYSEKMHHRLLKENKGVSLERLSPFQPIDNPNNWHSASATEGFATPGYQNSNIFDGGGALGITVEPKIFVPDAIGTQPYTTISYKTDQAGMLATLRIYGIDGTLIRELCQNAIWGNEGFYLWDGTDEKGLKVRPGYYMVLVEIFDLNGEVIQIRKTVVVGTNFN